MNREQIEKAPNDYIGHPYEVDEGLDVSFRRDAFKEGAEWRINSVWHDASKEPKNGKTILLFYGSDFPSLLHKRATLRKWKEYVNGMKVIRWAYVEDLVPNT